MFYINICKRLHTAQGEMNLSFESEIADHSLVTLCGPSGAGKTTILRCLAGLTSPDSGIIKRDESVWYSSESGINLKPGLRKTGVVFQDYALFPNMTVAENIGAAAEKSVRSTKTEELLHEVGLTALADRKPHQLSGGQKQRTALARALASEPRLLLLDEPLSALDHEMRSTMQELILRLHRQYRMTTVLISHDLSEVFRMSDMVYIMDHGRILKSGKPMEVFTEKRISAKFSFTGEILNIKKSGLIYIIDALVGNDIVRVAATEREIEGIAVGSRVLISSKAFNPLIMKL